MDVELKLAEGLNFLDIPYDDRRLSTLTRYLFLLEKWNKTYNLSGIKKIDDMLSLNILDSAAISPFIDEGKQILDAGTGAGLPGLVLAILKPGSFFTLVDSGGKKTRFVFQCIHELGLENARVLQIRVEKHKGKYDVITSRAVWSIGDMFAKCKHLLAAQGFMLAMKGRKDLVLREIESLPGTMDVKTFSVKLPFAAAQRHVVKICCAGRILKIEGGDYK